MAFKYRIEEVSLGAEPAPQAPGPPESQNYAAYRPIPPMTAPRRISPALDPVARMRISGLAKWGLVVGILLLVVWLPVALTDHTSRSFEFAWVTSAAILSATVVTGLPRVIIPRLFGQWREAVVAVRDWLMVGLFTGLLYYCGIKAAEVLNWVPLPVREAGALRDIGGPWWYKRLPILLVAFVIAILIGRTLAIRRETLGEGHVRTLVQIVIQTLLMGLVYPLFHDGIWNLARIPGARTFLLVPAVVCLLTTLGILIWAWAADRNLRTLHNRGTVVDPTVPVELTLAVVGGRESGKTVLLAAAYYEWSLQAMGSLRIEPAAMGTVPQRPSGFSPAPGYSPPPGYSPRPGFSPAPGYGPVPGFSPQGQYGAYTGGVSPSSGPGQSGMEDNYAAVLDLHTVADNLYTRNEWPLGTVGARHFRFDLYMGSGRRKEKVARFNLLDYPGGAVTGKSPDPDALQYFWDHVDKADGVLFIADMSAVRRGQRDDYMEIKRAYRTVLERLVARNGRNRVVPIALVLTKCDEYVDQNTGGLNHRAIEQGLWAYGYNDIAPEWAQMNDEAGPGFVEFTQWTTSAITFSRPKEGPDGNWDFTQPFDIAPPPPPIMPSNCAAPLLWLSAKVLRWNVTMFSDLRSFLLGHSPKSRRHIDAALELERVANMRAAQ